jgi:twinkle protein
MNEINGFKIAKYNIHGFQEGVRYSLCPLCSESRKNKTQKCCTLHWDTGLAKCHHCGEVIQMHEFEKKATKKDYKIPEWKNNTKISDNAIKWFENRKISQFILRLMKITEGKMMMPDKSKEWKEKNTIQFNYFRYGQLVNIKYRSGDKNFLMVKDAEKIPYNLDNVLGNEVIYWVEGEMDVLAVMECGIHNVTSPPNGFNLPDKNGASNVNLDFLNNDIECFTKAEKLILAFDNDEAGQNGKREFIRRFGAHKCYTIDLKDCKDANEFSIKYGTEELKKTLEVHIEIPLENISTYSDFKDETRNFFLNGSPKGLVTGNLKSLDEKFSVNLSHTVLITGKPSSGKSDVADQMAIGYALNYGYNVGVVSVENKPNHLHFQKLVKKVHGQTPKERKDFTTSFEMAEDFVNEHFFMIDLIGGYELDKVLLKAEELVYRKGIRILIIDPFNKVKLKGQIESVTGNKTNDYTNAYIERLNNFGAKFDVLNLLVAHPVKLQKKENGKREIPDFYDVKGGGEFYDMCEHGLVVERDYQLDLTLIRTLKVKFIHLGSNNEDCWFKYNVNNGRLNDISGDINEPMMIKPIWDNSSWLKYDNVEQKEIFSNELVPDKREWYEKEPGGNEDVPF